MKFFLILLTLLAQGDSAHLPAWLAPFPKTSHVLNYASASGLQSAYSAPAPVEALVAFYEAEMRTAGIAVQSSFDGIGTTLRATQGSLSCVVRVNEADGGSHVRVDCADLSAPPQPVPSVLPTRVIMGATTPPKPVKEEPGMRPVEFHVDGSAHQAVLTFTNANGGKEQKTVTLPFANSFYARGGSALTLSAEKVMIKRTVGNVRLGRRTQTIAAEGNIHVAIRVTGQILGEATTAPGSNVATANVTIPR